MIVGDQVSVAHELLSGVEDGFDLVRVVSPASLESFVDLAVAEPQDCGVFNSD